MTVVRQERHVGGRVTDSEIGRDERSLTDSTCNDNSEQACAREVQRQDQDHARRRRGDSHGDH